MPQNPIGGPIEEAGKEQVGGNEHHAQQQHQRVVIHRAVFTAAKQGKDFVGSDVYGVNTSLACCDVGHGTLWNSQVLRPPWNRNGIELLSRRVKDDHVIGPRDPELVAVRCAQANLGYCQSIDGTTRLKGTLDRAVARVDRADSAGSIAGGIEHIRARSWVIGQ